jgi:hypothetical protein
MKVRRITWGCRYEEGMEMGPTGTGATTPILSSYAFISNLKLYLKNVALSEQGTKTSEHTIHSHCQPSQKQDRSWPSLQLKFNLHQQLLAAKWQVHVALANSLRFSLQGGKTTNCQKGEKNKELQWQPRGFGSWINWDNGVCPMFLNGQRNNPVVGVPNFWKPMEYPHKFINYINLNQQSH